MMEEEAEGEQAAFGPVANKEDYYCTAGRSIELAFIRKCQQSHQLSIDPSLLPDDYASYFVHSTLHELLSCPESERLLTGNTIRYIANKQMELIECEKQTYNHLIHLFETLASDPSQWGDGAEHETGSEMQLAYKKILGKLRIALHNQSECMKIVKYTRQNVLKVCQQCSKLNTRLVRKRDAIQRILCIGNRPDGENTASDPADINF